MKKSIKHILFFVTALLLASCNDFFELQTPPEFPYKSPSDFEMSAIGAYNSAFNYKAIDWENIYGIDLALDFIGSDLSRYVGSIHSFPHSAINERKYSTPIADKLDGPYLNAYRTIACSSSALDFVKAKNNDPFPFADKVMYDLNVKRIIGELHFLRAYSYFFLVRQFHPAYNPGGDNSFKKLPLRKNMAANLEQSLNPQGASTQEIYDFIVEDLEAAKTFLPERFVDGMFLTYKYGRVTKFTAEAILARVYMMMGRFDERSGAGNALENLNNIVLNGGFELEKNPLSCFNRAANNYTLPNKELIWEIFAANKTLEAFTPAAMTHFSKCGMFRSDNSAATGGRGKNFDLNSWTQYSMNNSYLKKRLKWISDVPQDEQLTDIAKNDKRYVQLYYFLYKFTENVSGKDTMHLSAKVTGGANKEQHSTIWVDKFYRASDARRQNVPAVRYAEVLLHRATILFNKGDKAGAAADLNKITLRAWNGTVADYVPVTAATITDEMLENEYIKEMAGEGTWIMYLQSLRKPIPAGDHVENGGATGTLIEAPYSNMYWPIPASENLFINK